MAQDPEITKPELTPARNNIWYVLATIAGEPQYFRDPNIEKNRYYWNGLMRPRLTDEQYAAVKDREGHQIELPGLTTEDHDHIRKVLDSRGFEGVPLPEQDKEIDFSNTEFPRFVSFEGFVFVGDVDFQDATFNLAFFQHATFEGRANFQHATFTERADFENATFEGYTYFQNATFTGYANFQNAIFEERTLFNSAKFLTKTDFSKGKFLKTPPAFYDASISQAINWDQAEFPNPPTDREDIVSHINAYERLSLMMSNLEKTHEKHMFFRHEMRARRALETGWKKWPAKAMNWIYDISCEYGYNFSRALVSWVSNIGIGAILLFVFGGAPKSCAGALNALAVSFANAHSFLGLNRGPLKAVYAQYSEGSFFNALWVFQAVFGIICLFFLLLTLRNRFKMG